jgi:hypothetical protein
MPLRAQAALISDVSHDDSHVPSFLDMPTLECADEYDNTEVSVSFHDVAFSLSLTPRRDLSHF